MACTHTYTHTMEYYSAIRNETLPFAAMDGPRDYHTKWSKSDRERQILYDITYMWNIKRWYKWIYLQNRKRLTDMENKLMVTKGEGGRNKLGVWD